MSPRSTLLSRICPMSESDLLCSVSDRCGCGCTARGPSVWNPWTFDIVTQAIEEGGKEEKERRRSGEENAVNGSAREASQTRRAVSAGARALVSARLSLALSSTTRDQSGSALPRRPGVARGREQPLRWHKSNAAQHQHSAPLPPPRPPCHTADALHTQRCSRTRGVRAERPR